MSHNCKSTYAAGTTRDVNNNTLCYGGVQGYGGRSYSPPGVTSTGNYQQVTAKVLIGSMTAINDLKRQEKPEREARRAH